MGVLKDILNDIDFKGKKTSIIIKSTISISTILIASAFFIGQLKTNHINKLNNIEEMTKKNLEKSIELEKELKQSIYVLETKIDKVYNDGFDAFEKYREFNNKQLKLIIEHNDENSKEILKEIIDLKSDELSYEINSKYKNDSIKNIKVEKILK